MPVRTHQVVDLINFSRQAMVRIGFFSIREGLHIVCADEARNSVFKIFKVKEYDKILYRHDKIVNLPIFSPLSVQHRVQNQLCRT